MPKTSVYFYKERLGVVPVLDWLLVLRDRDERAYASCVEKLLLLQTFGHELRRPYADYLRDGIYELRMRRGRVQIRILYSFEGKNVALLTHAFVKEQDVPQIEIKRALERRALYRNAPFQHRHLEDWLNG